MPCAHSGAARRRFRRRVGGAPVRAGQPEHGDGRAARRAARHRPGDGAEDRRLPDRSTAPSTPSTSSMRSPASAPPSSTSSAAWSCRDRGAAWPCPTRSSSSAPRAAASRRQRGTCALDRNRRSLAVGSSLLARGGRCHQTVAIAFALAFLLAGWWWGRHAARRDRPQPTGAAARDGRARPGRRHGTAAYAPGSRSACRPSCTVSAGCTSTEPVLLELPVGRAPAQGDVLDVLGRARAAERAGARLRRADLAPPPRHPRGAAGRPLARRRPARRTRRRRRPDARVRHAAVCRAAARASGVPSCSASCSARTKGCRKACATASAPRASTTCWRSQVRTSRSSPAARCSSPGSPGIPRLVGEFGALAAIAAYVLAVGAQPSVVRAGIAGALGSIAWLLARERDRWWFLLVGAFVLLAWNPYTLLDAGFQLSFAAVVAIFTLAPADRTRARGLSGAPRRSQASSPSRLRAASRRRRSSGCSSTPCRCSRYRRTRSRRRRSARSSASHSTAAAVHPLAPSAAAALTWLAGWCAAYLAFCARLMGGLPFAQVRSGWAAAAIGLGAALAGTYAWRRCRKPS